MLLRLALLVLFGMVLAWYQPSPAPGDVSMPPLVHEETPLALSEQQVHERTEQCGKTSRDAFRREWQEGAASTEDGLMTAGFASHYNVKLDACFLLLTVSEGTASSNTLSKRLFDINERELYGEYSGVVTSALTTVGLPATCRVAGFYCASRGEWDVLVARYMEE